MRTKTISAPWLLRITWIELITLLVCLSLDLVDYFIPIMMTPIVGDVLDFMAFVFCVLYFDWASVITLAELLPGLDILPLYSITWLTWYLYRRRRQKIRIESELEKWR